MLSRWVSLFSSSSSLRSLPRILITDFSLPIFFSCSVGVEKSPEKAIYYYTKSALAGQPRGEGILGFCYGEGFGVDKDEKKAFQLYLRAAEKGESVSMYNVAHCYEEGIGVPKSLQDAL